MITTATSAATSSRQQGNSYAATTVKGRRRRPEAKGVCCPECGCNMEERKGKHGTFHGCVRFPLCVGAIPVSSSKAKPYDSYTQLLLDAHKMAVNYLSKEYLLGKLGCIAWFIRRPLLLTNVETLLQTVEEASAEATRLGFPKDFIQSAHNERMGRARGSWRNKYSGQRLRELPKPVFTHRWDDSLIEQIELDLMPFSDDRKRKWDER